MNEHRYRCRGCRHLYICECADADAYAEHLYCALCTPHLCREPWCMYYATHRVEFADGSQNLYCEHHADEWEYSEGLTLTPLEDVLEPLAEPFRVVEP